LETLGADPRTATRWVLEKYGLERFPDDPTAYGRQVCSPSPTPARTKVS
jgi:hypothetical protein